MSSKQAKPAAAKRAKKQAKPAAAKPRSTDRLPPGKNGNTLPVNKNPFSKTNQPSPEAKKAGWAKRLALKELIDFKPGKLGDSKTDYAKLTAIFYGIAKEEVTIKMIMEYRQIERAVLKGDTGAYIAVMDRAIGKPKQAIELIPDMTIKINGKVIKQNSQ